MDEEAERVVLAFEADGGDPGRVAGALDADRFRAYLHRVHEGPVAVGDEWSEFVTEGCSAPRDVVLRVVAVDGGSRLGPGTALAFERR